MGTLFEQLLRAQIGQKYKKLDVADYYCNKLPVYAKFLLYIIKIYSGTPFSVLV